MKKFGPFLSNLRSSSRLTLKELTQLVNSNTSDLSRLENNDIPQPFRGKKRQLVIALAEILCTSKSEIKKYLELAEIDLSLLSETEQIQVGFTLTVPHGSPEETINLERSEQIYKELLARLESKQTVLGKNHPCPNLRRKIQEYIDALQDLQKRIEEHHNRQNHVANSQLASLSPVSTIISSNPPNLQQAIEDKETTPTSSNIRENTIPSIFDLGVTDKLDSTECIINLAWEAWFASRPKAVARSINKLLPSLEKIAYSPYPPSQTLRAKELTIRAHGLLGTICSDAAQNNTALFHYMQAHRFAEEIHDEDLAAIYLCLTGEALRQQNDQPGALSYMENARDRGSRASKTTRGYILQMLAYAYGDTGQETAFESTISEATDLLAFSGEGRDITQKEFIPFEIYETRGKIYRDLGKPLEAIPYLGLAEKSLIAADSVTPRWHALLDISKAQAYCDANDITTGIELASKGFILAYQCHSPHQMNRVRKLLRKLENGPFKNHPDIQNLKNLLFETYMRMDNETMPRNPNIII